MKILYLEDDSEDIFLLKEYIQSQADNLIIDPDVIALQKLDDLFQLDLNQFPIIVTDLNLIASNKEETKKFWKRYKPLKSVLIAFTDSQETNNLNSHPFDFIINKGLGYNFLIRMINLQARFLD